VRVADPLHRQHRVEQVVVPCVLEVVGEEVEGGVGERY
jgi:hypothetical protein